MPYEKDKKMKFLKCSLLLVSSFALGVSAYIVKQGDTLWDLSEEFFQDPFAWPDLWEKNRHIEDPHWIYPGDSIYLGNESANAVLPDSAIQKLKEPNCHIIADSTLPKGVVAVGCDTDSREADFENMLGDLRSRSKNQKKKKSENVYYYQKRPAPKIFNAYYQVHSPITYSLEDLKKDSSWFSIRTGEKIEPLIHIPENEIVVGFGKKTNIKAKKGDIVEIWDAKKISFPLRNGKTFKEHALLRLSAYAKITAVGDTLSRARIVQTFREVYIKQSKVRLKRNFKPINVNGYKTEKEVEIKDMAQITYAMDKTLIVGAYSYILIDKGQKSGYNPGDGVAIWEKDNSDPSIAPRLLGRGVITGSSAEQASVLIHELYSASRRVAAGHLVSVTHKANLVQ